MNNELRNMLKELLEQLYLLNTSEIHKFRAKTFKELHRLNYPQFVLDCYTLIFDCAMASDRR